MISEKYAVIDLGSNTFHLLIAEVVQNIDHYLHFKTVYRNQVFVGLSDGGDTFIKDMRMELGLNTLRQFKVALDDHNAQKIKVVGTAVLRRASNRQEFIDAAEAILDQKINIIDGDQEADYIYNGIRQIGALNHGLQLIMDVGGGSTEFIVMEDGRNTWQKSFRLGGGVLHQQFHKSEPISTSEISALSNHIITELADLKDFMSNRGQLIHLAGASGSFEMLATLAGRSIQENQYYEISLDSFARIYNDIVHLDLTQREEIDLIPRERAKLLSVGLILKKTVIDLFKPKNILVSPYAMKEGILSKMVQE